MSNFTVVGPEVPLVAGLIDVLTGAGTAFGPSAGAARLEGSKMFAKDAMEAAGVPTARWSRVRTLQEGIDAVGELEQAGSAGAGVVIKADGLAAGKGVTVADTSAQAETALREIFVEGRFGDGDVSAVVEERLTGEELSLLAVCDGQRAVALAPARDFKRIGEGDQGPNTGGMGSYSPVAGFDEERVQEIVATVHQPVVDLMRERGTPFHGVLYAGLMLTPQGPRGARVQRALRRSRDAGGAAATADGFTRATARRHQAGRLGRRRAGVETRVGGDARVGERRLSGVLLQRRSDRGPGAGARDDRGDARRHSADTAGVVTAGGRVLNVTALGADPGSARDAAYAAAEMISFDGMQMRHDIAADAASGTVQTTGEGTT